MAANDKDDDVDIGSVDNGKSQPTGMKSFMVGVSQAAATATAYRKQRVFHYADTTTRLLYTVSFIAAIAAGTALPLMNIVFGRFVTTFNSFAVGDLEPSAYMCQVETLALYFVYLFVAKFVLVYIHTLCVSVAAIRTTTAVRLHFLQSLLRQEMAYFDSKDAGSPSVKVTTNANLINNGISDKLSSMISSLSTFVAAFVVAFAVQWKLTLITISIVPVIIMATGLCFALDAPIEKRMMAAYDKAAVLAEEVFSTITTIHSFWLQPLMARRYDSHLAVAEREAMKKCVIYGVLFSTQFFCIYSGYALAFWQGTRMYTSGDIREPGKIVTVIFALVLAATSLVPIATQIMTIGQSITAANELFAVIDRPSMIDPESDTGLLPISCSGHIEIEGVEFEYPSRQHTKVLRDLTLSIPTNKTTALVGASGSGKSTIVGLLERWYNHSAGTISIDGTDIRELNLRWLRQNVRLVQQEPVLFSGTVYDNVAHGLVGTEHEHASHEHKMQLVRDTCRAAFAHDFVDQLPNQYLTKIGEGARMLSGGQRQRIAIARSIISNPPVLLLDEATSALDPNAEKIVQDALDNVSKSRTTLTIAHKLSTVQKADNIAVISEGAVIEQGTHRELIDGNGAYARLVRAQSLEQAVKMDSSHLHGDKEYETDANLEEPSQHGLSRLETNVSSAQLHETGPPKLLNEGMGYSLLKCLFLLITEHRQLWPAYFALGLLSIFAGGTWPALAVLFSHTFSVFQLQGGAAVRAASFWALMFFVVALGNLLIYFSIGVVCNIVAQKVTRKYRLQTFNNTIKQDIAFFDQEANSTGATVSRLSTCSTDLHELLGFNAGVILNNLVTVVACSILGIAYGWKLGLACTFGALPPVLLSGYARIRLETKLDNDTAKRFANSATLATEAVASIRTVASLTLEATIIGQYKERLSFIASRSIKVLLSTMVWYAFTQSVNFLAMALGFWYGGKLVSSGEYTTGQFFVVFIAVILGGENAAQFFSYTTSITKATKAANYIFWLRGQKPAIAEDAGHDPKESEKDRDIPTSVDCEEVDFAYPSRPNTNVIKHIYAHAPAGQFVAFVGASGCGKSTMISLLSRFYDPTSGVVKMDGHPIADIGPRQHRGRLALVQQEPVLYSGSVRDNVAMGLIEFTEPTEAQIEEALRNANILDFVHSLPEGLDTTLGNQGAQLSGGQRQRVAIARALVRQPRVLLLDEATSALDTESEKIVQAALMEAAKDGGRTTIAVAHRLSTIKDADAIFVFQAGRIVESGTHASLLAQRGMYFDMCEGQALYRAP